MKAKHMTFEEALGATLGELNGELGAAGWESDYRTRREAFFAVVSLIDSWAPETLPDEYREGRAAAQCGDDPFVCPYSPESFSWDLWQAGWHAGAY